MHDTYLDNDQAVQLANVFRLLGNRHRLRLMRACVKQAASVRELAESLNISPSRVRRHLNLLVAAQLMDVGKRDGRNVYRVVNPEVRLTVHQMVPPNVNQRSNIGPGAPS